MILYHWIVFERNISQKLTEKQQIHFMFKFFLRKSCRLRDNVEKHGTA